MNIRNRSLLGLFSTLLFIVLLFVALSYGLYWQGARHLPHQLTPAEDVVPEEIRRQFIAIEADGARRIQKLNPVSLWWTFGRMVSSDPRSANRSAPEGWRLLSTSARIVNGRQPRAHQATTRHLIEIAAMIKISR